MSRNPLDRLVSTCGDLMRCDNIGLLGVATGSPLVASEVFSVSAWDTSRLVKGYELLTDVIVRALGLSLVFLRW